MTGGRAEGHGRTSDGALEVDLRAPAELGGEGGGTNPEQLFAVGFAACFEGAIGVVGRRERAEVGDVSIDSQRQPDADRGPRACGSASSCDVHAAVGRRRRAGRASSSRRAQGLPVLDADRGNVDAVLSAGRP